MDKYTHEENSERNLYIANMGGSECFVCVELTNKFIHKLCAAFLLEFSIIFCETEGLTVMELSFEAKQTKVTEGVFDV